ncbi:flagellar protein FlaG [Paraperlucidibaca baekdonensis]|uniref:Flagellar protein FlaG n=1 Tax=Paraperlucidibaca baekdonensis TaxID=748120 RepID=A0A3E0H1W1_9GAMM|nr:flagellar protein FlaG [Paraperlucidibaca baekdonensis]REH36751.1 flagellar protein FlaG [Paraperlucidibaca baekdonensis]
MTIAHVPANTSSNASLTVVKSTPERATSVAAAEPKPVVDKSAPKAAPEPVSPALLQQWQAQLQAQRKLEFSVDESSGRDVVKVIDSDSGDLIRQFPSEEVLKLSSVAKSGKGGLFADEA